MKNIGVQFKLNVSDYLDTNDRAILEGSYFRNLRAQFLEALKWAQTYYAQVASGLIRDARLHIRRGEEYAESILDDSAIQYPYAGDKWRFGIFPDQALAHQCEDFLAPYDMKPGILHGPHSIHRDKDGRIYKNVPFRHDDIPNDIMAIMRPKRPQIISVQIELEKQGNRIRERAIGHNVIQRGERLKYGELPERHRTPETNIHDVAHKTPKFEGMVKVQQRYEKATQNMFMTWRRIHETRSPQTSWWHPGFEESPVSVVVMDAIVENLKDRVALGLAQDIREALQ